MRLLFLFLFLAGCLAFVVPVNAQSLGKPVVNETFGTGSNPGQPLPSGITNLIYTTNPCPDDKYYTIVNSLTSSCFQGSWFNIPNDHTGDPNGYFMVINASQIPSVFYTQRVSGNTLCPSTTYLFNAYVMNILRNIPGTNGFSQPDIIFSVEKPDGTVLGSFETNSIPATTEPKWLPFGFTFVSPADGSDVVIKMTNKAPGGNGNDLALDDITFSPYGIAIPTGFNNIADSNPQNHCEGDPLIYTLKSDETGYSNPRLQWQQKLPGDADWTSIPGQTSKDLQVNVASSVAGTYQYRIGVLDGAKTSPNCIIYSDPLTINVYPHPVNTLSATTGACIGQPLQLSATGGDTYSWGGPNGFTSTASNPTVTSNATLTDQGEYRVTITKNGCSTTGTTTVTVYAPPTVDPIQSVFICEGSSQQIIINASNATHYKWTPSTGLDHDDVANPIASPAVTTTYQVAVTNDGCSGIIATRPVTVTVWKKPKADAGQTIKIFAGQSAKLNGSAKGDDVTSYWEPYFYLDNPSSLTPTATPPQDITYTLHVVSNDGCGESTSPVFVRVYQLLTIPNTFSPNGDGINDKWNIRNLNTYPNALVSIYNRNGQPVFQSRGYSRPWDGTYNGVPLPVGTYYYVIDLQEDGLPKQSGWLLIVR